MATGIITRKALDILWVIVMIQVIITYLCWPWVLGTVVLLSDGITGADWSIHVFELILGCVHIMLWLPWSQCHQCSTLSSILEHHQNDPRHQMDQKHPWHLHQKALPRHQDATWDILAIKDTHLYKLTSSIKGVISNTLLWMTIQRSLRLLCFATSSYVYVFLLIACRSVR